MEAWMLCTSCSSLVKSAKEHCETTKHRYFVFPSDGDIIITFSNSKCGMTFNHICEVDMHATNNPTHKEFTVLNADEDTVLKNENADEDTNRVVFSIKKKDLSEFGKVKSLQELEDQGVLTPMMAPAGRRTRKIDCDIINELVSSQLRDLSLEQSSSDPQSSGLKMMQGRRSLEYFGISRALMEKKRSQYVIVEDSNKEDTLITIEDNKKFCDPQKNFFHFFLTNVNSDEGVFVFDKILKQLCLERKTHICSTDIINSKEKAERLWILLKEIKKLVESGETICLRDIYYQFSKIYETQKQSDRDVREISAMLGITMESLNIYASPTGVIKGHIQLFIGDTLLIDCSQGGVSGVMISAESHKVTAVRKKKENCLCVSCREGRCFPSLNKQKFPYEEQLCAFQRKRHA